MSKVNLTKGIQGGLAIGSDILNGVSMLQKASQIPDTSGLEAEAKQVGSTVAPSSSFDDLEQMFSSMPFAKTTYNYKDLLGKSDLEMVGEVFGNTAAGVGSGMMEYGPWGAFKGLFDGAMTGIGQGIAIGKAKDAASKLNRMGEEANALFMRNFDNSAKNIAMNKKNEALLNIAAFGGGLNTDFTNGVRFITEGGSHEQNPLGGVPQGIAIDGVPNLVEEGEVIYNDYVYSARLNLPNKDKEMLGIKKKDKITFAEAADIIQKESEERPNDPISKDTLDILMNRLRNSQESVKQKKNADDFKKAVNKMTPEELTMLAQQLAQPQQMQPMQGMQSMQPAQAQYPMFALGGLMGKKFALGGYSEYLKGVKNPAEALTEEEWYEMMGSDASDVPEGSETWNTTDGVTNPKVTGYETYIMQNTPEEEALPESKQSEESPWAQALRAAPVMGALTGAITSLFDKPNYNNIARAERAMATVPKVSFTPIGQKLAYTPIDINYIAAQLGNQGIGARRAIQEGSAGNGAVAGNALAALNYGSTTALGNAYMQAMQMNDEKKKAVADFNRGTDMFNSQGIFDAAKTNQALDIAKADFLKQTGQLRDAEMAAVQAARSANLSNAFQQLGNLGTDILNRDMVKAGIDSGVYGTMSESMKKMIEQIGMGAFGGSLNTTKNKKKGGKHA